METKSWGIFKGTHNGEGIYWSQTYNVEGSGSFRTIAEARQYIDALQAKRRDAKRAENMEKVARGEAIKCEHIPGDAVTVHLPDGLVTLPIRAYRQNVFTWEDKYGKEFVWL